MPLTRRLAAALFSILLLQLTLLGSGTLCGMHGNGKGQMRAHDMRAMNGAARVSAAPGSAAQRASVPDVQPVSPSPCDGPTGGADCGLPWAPGQCSSMTSCTVSAAPASAVIALSSASRALPDLADPATIGSRPLAAPELPPPRA